MTSFTMIAKVAGDWHRLVTPQRFIIIGIVITSKAAYNTVRDWGSGYGLWCDCCASRYFRFVRGCILTSGVGISLAPEPPSSISAGISISCVNSASGLYSTSGSTLILRPPLARDLVTWCLPGVGELAPFLSHLFSLSLQQGVVPTSFKSAFICSRLKNRAWTLQMSRITGLYLT